VDLAEERSGEPLTNPIRACEDVSDPHHRLRTGPPSEGELEGLDAGKDLVALDGVDAPVVGRGVAHASETPDEPKVLGRITVAHSEGSELGEQTVRQFVELVDPHLSRPLGIARPDLGI
jgi:hypothetical protein